MDQDFADTFREYLITATTWLPQEQRAGASWIMSREWFDDLIHLVDAMGYPLLHWPMSVDGPMLAYGYPVTVREDAGAPLLVPAEES